jgi:thiamine-phosphate pyrophosphorylase
VRGLYPIVDADTLESRGIPLLAFAERLLVARPPILQLRAKHWGGRDTLSALRALSPLCRASGTLLFANDRPDLALLAECAGVHVGQDDVPVALVRKLGPDLRIGVSTHDLAQLEAALDQRPDYVAFGPIFGTSSKENPDPVVGLDGLASAAALCSERNVPLVAIGGITLERAPEIARRGALGAVIAALLPSSSALDEVTERALAFTHALA